jgi:hypothetical protein
MGLSWSCSKPICYTHRPEALRDNHMLFRPLQLGTITFPVPGHAALETRAVSWRLFRAVSHPVPSLLASKADIF